MKMLIDSGDEACVSPREILRSDNDSEVLMQQFHKAVGVQLQRLRQAHGLSIAAYARQSGVARSTITRVERGCSNTRLRTLLGLIYTLEASVVPFFQAVEEDLGW